MSATATEVPKVEDLVTIEVDGQSLQARKGAMLIDVTDAAGIYIPRFCYHRKLSVAANCRMCLVEVERAPKPQPACATPVMDGMKVLTRSPKAVSGQQATMEFLLINHPLDCPICDQGGECELQDLALGYGSAVSQFTERKRVVRDKDIGPLVQTDMTRCIHCTRCVRFGEEIAGLRELGATGRGEHVEIGTYVAQAMTSELSGNVIDLCPVGALTSKPYRYSARAWELRQFETVAPHDCVGSRLLVHVKGQVVKRVVPGENEAVNETWISDRDRFAYQGLTSPDRLLAPRIKVNGAWQECDWETALAAFETALRGAEGRIGALASPSSTCEELFLLQRLVRELGGRHIDHRLRQLDFSADDSEPLFPSLGGTLAELEQADTVLVVGGYPRHDQPIVNHRIRKAAQRGARVCVLDTLDLPDNFDGVLRRTVAPSALEPALASLVAALAGGAGAAALDPALAPLAAALQAGQRVHVLAGIRTQQHPRRGALLALLQALAHGARARFGLLTEGANAAGAWLAGAVPHRGPAGRRQQPGGKHAGDMFETPLDAYVLLGLEPDADLADPYGAQRALSGARSVVALSAFTSPALEQHCTLLLPVASFAENEGSFINLAGDWQSFAAAVKPPGVVRPAWKILRTLGERCGLPGFDAVSCTDVRRELQDLCGKLDAGAGQYASASLGVASAPAPDALERVTQVPLYRSDALVRRASALQQMPQAGDAHVHLSPATLLAHGLVDGARVSVTAAGVSIGAQAVADATVPAGCALIYAASALAAALPGVSHVSLAGGAQA